MSGSRTISDVFFFGGGGGGCGGVSEIKFDSGFLGQQVKRPV